MTPMEKYDAENAKLDVVEVMPLMRILLVDSWDPSAGEMPVESLYSAVPSHVSLCSLCRV